MSASPRPHAVVLALENALYTPSFFFVVLLVIVLTGAWAGLLLAVAIAAAASLCYQLFINQLQEVPAKAAVLITGCSSGFGAESAVRLSQLGFLVFATFHKESDVALLQSHSIPNLVPLLLDVSSAESCEAAVATVSKRLDESDHRLLGLVLNAGYAVSSPLELVPLDVVRREYETNVFGLIRLTQLFLPLIRQSRYSPHVCRIVIISSSLGLTTKAGGAVYTSTKHATEAIGDGFRIELSSWAIDVVMVEPGSHATPFHDKADQTQDSNMDRARREAGQRCGADVLARYDKMSKKGYSPPPSPSKQPIGVVVDAIVTGLLAKYAPARIKCGIDSAMGGVMGAFPAFVLDRMMGQGYV